MPSVTGFTAARMQEIEDAAIVDGNVDGSGNLILVRHDLTEINAGSVIGPVGPQGPTGATSIAVCTSATRPTGGARFTGLYIYETDTKLTYVWDGAAWVYRGGLIICTAATHPSSPLAGLPIYETDTHKFLVYNSAARFDPPWNLAWGIMDKKVSSNPVGPFNAETDIIVGNAITYKANRLLKITASFLGQIGTVANDFFNFKLKEGATQLRECAGNPVPALGGAVFDGKCFSATVSPAAGAHTYKLAGVRTAGTGQVTVQANAQAQIELTVEDIGPANNPA